MMKLHYYCHYHYHPHIELYFIYYSLGNLAESNEETTNKSFTIRTIVKISAIAIAIIIIFTIVIVSEYIISKDPKKLYH